MAKHVTQAAPKLTKVLFENERVRIIELNVKKGSKTEMHTHPAYFSYSFTPLNYKSTSSKGITRYAKQRQGTSSGRMASLTLLSSRTPHEPSSSS